MVSVHVSAPELFGANTGHMSEPGALVVPFVLGRDFDVAEIHVLLREALTRALCATGGSLASPAPFVGAPKVLLRQTLTRASRAYPSFLALLGAEKTVVTTAGQTREFNPQDQILDISNEIKVGFSPIGFAM